jgi:translocation and assembly module TamB
MAQGKGKKRVLRAGALILAALLILWLSVPLWFPWLLEALAKKQGITYRSYERIGYSRFALQGVAFTNKTISFHADRATALVPTVWLMRSTFSSGTAPFAEVADWTLRVTASGEKTTGPPVSAAQTIQTAGRLVQKLERWMPSMALTNGTILIQKEEIRLKELTWSQGRLQGRVELPRRDQKISLQANLTRSSGPYEITLVSETLKLHSTITLASEPNGLRVQAASQWWSNNVALTASFGTKGMLPEKAHIEAQDFNLPATALQLEGYTQVHGSLSGDWENGKYKVQMLADAQPQPGQTNWPPAHIQLSAAGDTNAVAIEQAIVSSPALDLNLSQPLTIYFSGPLVRDRGHLRVSADLSRQPWIPVRGTLAGDAEFMPGPGKFPSVQFNITGTNIAYTNITTRELTLRGDLDWPRLQLETLRAVFDDGSTAIVSGQADLTTKILQGGQFEFHGGFANRWLPPNCHYENASVTGRISGALTAPAYEGQAIVTQVASPGLKPLDLNANLKGQGTRIENFRIALNASNASIAAAGSFDISKSATNVPPRFNLLLNELALKNAAGNELKLVHPVEFSASGAKDATLGVMQLAGSGGSLTLNGGAQWPAQGNLQISATNLGSDLVADFVTNPPPSTIVRSLEASANWTNGPLAFQVRLDAEARGLVSAGAQASPTSGVSTSNSVSPLSLFENSALQLEVSGDARGIAISNFVATASTGVVAVAKGFLPVTFHPSMPERYFQVATNQPVELQLTTSPESIFWNHLAQWTGVTLQRPEFTVNIAGTWESPTGRARLQADAIEIKKVKAKLPRLEHLQAEVVMDQREARVENAQVLVQGQPVILTAHMPLGPGFWEGLTQKKGPNWESASARVEITKAKIAAFSELFPTLLSPQGEFTLNVELLPGGKFKGDFDLEGARMRPLPSIGAVRDIQMRLKFAERELLLQQGAANIGGAAVVLTGKADLSGPDWLNGMTPPFELVVRGTNVPLSRQPESIVRSDLDIAIKQLKGAPAMITGRANIRDSYYLSDLTDLVPGRAASPSRRPPYFSIDVEPLAEWRLAVNVTGDRGFRVRSTLFNGQISVNLKLTGTLKEPIALGEARIDTGVVRFPFATLDVQQGFVTLTSADPYRPQLLVNAASKRFGYDVRMDVTGPADTPVIKFSSTPPLSSEQLVMMMTAGELPRGSFNLTPQQKAQTVAIFLGKDLLAKLGFGDQSEERLTVNSGQEISEQGRPTYSLEYKLTKRWSLVGEYDRFNAFNAGLKWRVYSK